jgi:hypothetical protein
MNVRVTTTFSDEPWEGDVSELIFSEEVFPGVEEMVQALNVGEKLTLQETHESFTIERINGGQ